LEHFEMSEKAKKMSLVAVEEDGKSASPLSSLGQCKIPTAFPDSFSTSFQAIMGS
jgi:hypothetical protein